MDQRDFYLSYMRLVYQTDERDVLSISAEFAFFLEQTG